MSATCTVPTVGVFARVNAVLDPLIAPDGVSRNTKFPVVRLAIWSAVHTRAVVPRVIASVTSFHHVSAFTVPSDTYTTASAISVAVSASVARVGAPDTLTI